MPPQEMSDEQKVLHLWLGKYSSELADLYAHSLVLLEQKDSPGAKHLIAHCVREILNRLPELVSRIQHNRFQSENRISELKIEWKKHQPGLFSSTQSTESLVPIPVELALLVDELVRDHDSNQSNKRERIARMLTSLVSERTINISYNFVNEWLITLNWFVKFVHVGSTERTVDHEELRHHFLLFQNRLVALIKGASLAAKEIRELANEANTLDENCKLRVKEILAILSTDRQKTDFYDSLTNEKILPILDGLGEFARPADPAVNYATGIITTYSWAQGRYLSRCGYAYPSISSKVITECKNSLDFRVVSDLINLLLTLPDEVFVRHFEDLRTWLRGTTSTAILWKLTEVVKKLAISDTDKCFKLFCDAIAVKRGELLHETDEFKSYDRPSLLHIRESVSFDLLSPTVLFLSTVDPRRTVAALCGALTFAIESRGKDHNYDGSSIWRTHLFEKQELDRDALAALTSLLAHLITHELENAILSRIDALVEELKRWRLPLFRRFLFHIFSAQYPRYREDGIKSLLVQENLASFDSRIEYIGLLKNHFSEFTLAQRKEFFSKLDILISNSTSPESRARQKRDWLERIKAHLTNEEMHELELLTFEYGTPREYQPPRINVEWTSPSSDLDLEKLESISIQEILMQLEQPPGDDNNNDDDDDDVFFNASESCAVLKVVLQKRFSELFPHIQSLATLQPYYLRTIIELFNERIDELNDPVKVDLLELASRILDGTAHRKVQSFFTNDLIEETMQLVLNLSLSSGLFTSHTLDNLLEQLLMRDKNLETVALGNWENEDPLLVIVNFSFGKRFKALTKNLKLHSSNLEFSERIGRLIKCWWQNNEEKSILELATVASDFGTILHMDEEWAAEIANSLFPFNFDLKEFHYSWAAFMRSHRAHHKFFEILGNHYLYAVKTLSERGSTDQFIESDTQLSRHLITYGWLNLLELGHPLSILFWTEGSPRLRISALRFAGDQLFSTSSKPPDTVLEYLQKLWELATAECKTSEEHVQLESTFDLWFASGWFASSWALEKLKDAINPGCEFDYSREVIQKLHEMHSDHPLETVGILLKMIAAPAEPWQLHLWKDDAAPIVSAAFLNPDDRIKRGAMKSVDAFLQRGIDLRHLIPPKLPRQLMFNLDD